MSQYPALPRHSRMLEWLPGIERSVASIHLIAGLITAAVVIPKAMACATIAGRRCRWGSTPPSCPMVIYAVLGTSRPLSVSTTTTIAILTGAELASIAPGRRSRDTDQDHGDPRPPRGWHARWSPRSCAWGSSPTSSRSRCWSASRRESGSSSCWTRSRNCSASTSRKAGFLHNLLAPRAGVPETHIADTHRRGRNDRAPLVGARALRPAKLPAPLIAMAGGHRRDELVRAGGHEE